MKLGYNTNGFAFHRLEDAVEIIAELGYSCVALTLDVHHLNPFTADSGGIHAFKAQLERLKLSCVIETGARFLLDPRRKHRPTLLDADAVLRVDFLKRAVDICAQLSGVCVSFWSGARPEDAVSDDELYARLASRIDEVEAYATARGVKLAIEPEPGFLIETMANYDRLCELLGRPLGLTLDIGHLQCVEREPPHIYVERYARELINVQLDDMKRGVHKHLMFGEGEVDFAPVFASLKRVGYIGPACVELSEASRDAVNSATKAHVFLNGLLK